MVRLLDAIRKMDSYICDNLCQNKDTDECPWFNGEYRKVDGEKILIKASNGEGKGYWRKCCHQFRCKRISPMSDELKGGEACAHRCPVWFICNMFKKRIRDTYQTYVKEMERIDKELTDIKPENEE